MESKNRKPVIGIVARPGTIFTSIDVQVNEETYKNAILRMGGIPISILPTQSISYQSFKPSEVSKMTDNEKNDLNQIISLCDAIIAPGGLKSYEYDYYIYNYAVQQNIPYLGICLGMQVMSKSDPNCTIERNNTSINHYNKESFLAHNVVIQKNTKLYDIIGKEEICVNSFHNYHVENMNLLTISSYAQDGIIEALENNKCDYNIGVQWHPEKDIMDNKDSQKIFESLIEKAKVYSKKR